jgi:hypothetical protein
MVFHHAYYAGILPSSVCYSAAWLEAVDLDCILRKGVLAHLVFVFIREEVHDFSAMITLQLNHLSHIGILDDGSIAGIFLFEGFKKRLGIVILR